MEDIGELLILEVSKNEALYRKSHPLFRDKLKKTDIWKVIGSRLDMSGKLNLFYDQQISAIRRTRVLYLQW